MRLTARTRLVAQASLLARRWRAVRTSPAAKLGLAAKTRLAVLRRLTARTSSAVKQIAALSIVTLVLSCLVPASAFAADTQPPVISHTPVTAVLEGTGIRIDAVVTDDTKVANVYLYFKLAGQPKATFVKMVEAGGIGGSYTAMIHQSYVKPGVLEYYIAAVDSQGNLAVSPVSGEAFKVEVAPLVIDPEVTLLSPQGVLSTPKGTAVALKLNSAFRRADASSFRIYLDGRDVTPSAQVSNALVTYVIDQDLKSGIHKIEFDAPDVNGKPFSESFDIHVKIPFFAGAKLSKVFSVESSFDSKTGTTSIVGKLDLAAQFGPFYASAKIRTDDPAFTQEPGQPTSKYQVGYDSRFLDIALLDVTPTLGSLTLDSYPVRGYSGELKLGPIHWEGVYGSSAQAVPGETYRRQVLAFRSGTDLFGILKGGLTFAQVSDRVVDDDGNPALILDSNGQPVGGEQSYTIGADASINLFGASVGVEAAANAYLNGVTTQMDWKAMLNEGNLSNPDAAARWFDLFLPLPDYWQFKVLADYFAGRIDTLPPGTDLTDLVTNLKSYLPVVDTACAGTVRIPVLIGDIEGRYFWTGQRFKALGASPTPGMRGYEVSLKNLNLGGVLSLNATIGSKVDKVESPLLNPEAVKDALRDMDLGGTDDATKAVIDGVIDFIAGQFGTSADISRQTQEDSVKASARLSIPGMPSLSFSVKSANDKDYRTGAAKESETKYRASIDSIRYSIFGSKGTAGIKADYSDSRDLLNKTDSRTEVKGMLSLGLPISTVRASAKVGLGYLTEYNDEALTDDDTITTSTNVELKVSKTFGKLSLSGSVKHERWLERTHGQPDLTTAKVTLGFGSGLSLGSSDRLNLDIRHVLENGYADSDPRTTASLVYRLTF